MINALQEASPIVTEDGEMEERFKVWTRSVQRETSVGDWQTPTLLNGWLQESFPTDFNDVQFRSLGDKRVEIRGLAVGGTVGQPIFNLPVGFRPLLEYLFVVNSNNAFGRVDITAGGDVQAVTGSNVFFALDGIVFSLD